MKPTLKFFLIVLALIAALCAYVSLPGCARMNTATSALINYESANYAAVHENIQKLEDAKFKAWVDMAATIPAGALQRNNTGNPNAVKAILLICPIPTQ